MKKFFLFGADLFHLPRGLFPARGHVVVIELPKSEASPIRRMRRLDDESLVVSR